MKLFYICSINSVSETVKQLDGVFAFCIWDSLLEEMFVARDPNGVRSLYMGISEDGIVITSELKSLQTLVTDRR